ncbi:hypothetical protein [Leucothrix arctica]|uniref:Outer membrane protein beta-barrel domain-containing protein n=1 Tax=Leucothrix arctica TaxID=1481894 RepID=A0A317C6K9_9GAMM|nr:hypothetical protein [Leucothrix arctica]PWQ93831.1 hypothetical protein DKT75_19710 [Leucothrix arctica]
MNNKRILSMLKTAVSSAALVLIASSSVAATADELVINYNYIEGAIEYSDTDENSTDVERLTVSYGVTSEYNVLADYSTGQDIDSTIDFDEVSLGAGYHKEVAHNTDLTANAKLVYQDFDEGSSDTRLAAGVGLRHQLMDDLEVNANLDYNDGATFRVGARYYLIDALSAGFNFSASSGEQIAYISLRWDY